MYITEDHGEIFGCRVQKVSVGPQISYIQLRISAKPRFSRRAIRVVLVTLNSATILRNPRRINSFAPVFFVPRCGNEIKWLQVVDSGRSQFSLQELNIGAAVQSAATRVPILIIILYWRS